MPLLGLLIPHRFLAEYLAGSHEPAEENLLAMAPRIHAREIKALEKAHSQ